MNTLQFAFWLWLAASGGALVGFVYGAILSRRQEQDEHEQFPEGL